MILVVNGPNINLLNEREKEFYGGISSDFIKKKLIEEARRDGEKIEWWQGNSQGEIIDHLQKKRSDADGLIINPAAYSHTGLALLDCLKMLEMPIIEVHISNTAARSGGRPERKELLTAQAAEGVIMGLGAKSYLLAYRALKNLPGGNQGK